MKGLFLTSGALALLGGSAAVARIDDIRRVTPVPLIAPHFCGRIKGRVHIRSAGSHRRYQETTKVRSYGYPVPMHPGDVPRRIVAEARRLIAAVKKEEEEDG